MSSNLKSGVCCVGSIIVDFIACTPSFPKSGETLLATASQIGLHGGKGANQAVQAARLGSSVRMIGKCGADAQGSEYIAHLNKEGIDTTCILLDNDDSTGVALIFVEQSTGLNKIIVVQGANAKLSAVDLEASEQCEAAIASSRVLVTQLETSVEATAAALRLAKRNGTLSILNPAPAPRDPAVTALLLPLSDIVAPNESEAEAMAGAGYSVSTIEEAAAAAAQLQSLGANDVLITLGERGCLIKEKGKEAVVIPPCPVPEVKDTTGAGDSFLGALSHFLAEGLSLEESAKRANHVASVSVGKLGTQTSFPRKSELPVELF